MKIKWMGKLWEVIENHAILECRGSLVPSKNNVLPPKPPVTEQPKPVIREEVIKLVKKAIDEKWKCCFGRWDYENYETGPGHNSYYLLSPDLRVKMSGQGLCFWQDETVSFSQDERFYVVGVISDIVLKEKEEKEKRKEDKLKDFVKDVKIS